MTGDLALSIKQCPWLRLSDSATEFPHCNSIDALPLLVVESPRCRATIAPQGAQLLSHQTAAREQLLWLSPAAIFAAGKPVRGGIPTCLPWFGPHSEDADKPQHGFTRNEDWQLREIKTRDGDVVELGWHFDQYSEQAHPLFPWRFRAQLVMTLGDFIELQLQVSNCDTRPMPLSWALHSYHPVQNLASVRVKGLDNCEFLDNTRGLQRGRQQGDVSFDGEYDRIFINVPTTQTIATQPPLSVRGDNCNSAIVWNPGMEKAADLGDMGSEHQQGFICLERGNAADNALCLLPAETHRASVHIELAQCQN